MGLCYAKALACKQAGEDLSSLIGTKKRLLDANVGSWLTAQQKACGAGTSNERGGARAAFIRHHPQRMQKLLALDASLF
eukprot:gene9169-8972_t